MTSLRPPAARPAKPAASSIDRLTRWLKPRLLAQLDRFEGGCITLIEPDGECHQLGRGGPLAVRVTLKRERTWRRLALGGTVGAGEAYMDDDWDTDDLVTLIRLFATNLERVNGEVENGSARFARWLLGAWHTLKRNTPRGSRRNISAHYDIGNELFELFLDRRHRMYSSALFPHAEASLEEASTYKLERLLDALDVGADNHLLEIGTGWGGLAIHAARTRGCRVTTTTLSAEQHAYAARRIAEEGLEDRITLLQQDYRELEGRFDRLVSVEMVEAVGHQYLGTYLATLDRLLSDDGLAALQAITIRDQRFEAAKRDVDFIKRYVFPGGFLPSHSAILTGLTRHTTLNLLDLEEIGPHYARTLREWRKRFEANLETVRRLGYEERFIRLWRYYLCYCEGGFLERSIGTCQLLLAKPGARRRPLTGQP
ncbi:cyclopropane-fatty-acyl-phospholipid synthase family protein [Halomonas sp. HP20-15]|uniref:cyclopropane-fatty-acyl-phospholipid synthase family protein n=1 Tax=Halomonas sp. HP20-15 TaxID=3085901 RepID=UPI0029822BCB|nr:cyclopropane-fatty-acyl-phospholipid synthase family protein [Halomonas sp. HP20-15]MDW5376148.1 cyclopropane-fatty-acyl-phospholipid synthase family protein [Halomonas sp. HP20-15]